MQKQPSSLQQLAKELEKEKIIMVIGRRQEDHVYDITYIDQERKSVFNAGDLSKEYAAKRMLERLGIQQQAEPLKVVQKETGRVQETSTKYPTKQTTPDKEHPFHLLVTMKSFQFKVAT